MELKFLKTEKNEVEVEFADLTIVEILRSYLSKDSSVTFVAWKRMHPTENPILKLETKDKDAKSVMTDAVKAIVSDLDEISKEFKALK